MNDNEQTASEATKNPIFEVSNEKTMLIIEFTETEKQIMKQID